MIRVWLAAGILLAWTGLSWYGAALVQEQCEQVTAALDALAAAEDAAHGQAVQTAWTDAEKRLWLFVPRDRLASAAALIGQLEPLRVAENDEFPAVLSAARSTLIYMAEGELPTCRNIL